MSVTVSGKFVLNFKGIVKNLKSWKKTYVFPRTRYLCLKVLARSSKSYPYMNIQRKDVVKRLHCWGYSTHLLSYLSFIKYEIKLPLLGLQPYTYNTKIFPKAKCRAQKKSAWYVPYDIRRIWQFSILSHQYWFSQSKQLTSYKMSSPYCLFVIYTNRVAPAEHSLHHKASNLLPEWHGGSHCGVGMLLLAGQTYTISHQVEVFGMWERTLPFNLRAPALFHSLSCEVGKLCQGQSQWDKPSSSRSVSTKSWSYSK